MYVKICGITDLQAAKTAIANGADALGFVFAESKRKITIEKAREIIKQLPETVLKVGVFVNEPFDRIEKIMEETGINVVQLHGDEDPAICDKFSVPVIKAFSIGSAQDLQLVNSYSCEYILLDSPKGKYHGGNGTTFDWDLIKTFQPNGKKVLLAGGLSEANVTEAVQKAKPYMVDVSSGVETDGKKDLEKIKRFLEKAKGALGEEVI